MTASGDRPGHTGGALALLGRHRVNVAFLRSLLGSGRISPTVAQGILEGLDPSLYSLSDYDLWVLTDGRLGARTSEFKAQAASPAVPTAPAAPPVYAPITLTQPAAGLSITSSVALGGTATFTLADDLAALEALSGSGLAVRTGTSSWAIRQLAAGTGVSLINADGVAGNPTISLTYSSFSLTQPAAGLSITSSVALGGTATFALADDLAALEALSGSGLAVRTGTSSWALRQLAAGTGVSLSNADGVAGNPTISLANIPNSALTYSSFTLTQPAAGLSITSSVALGGTATFALADDLAALEALSGSGLAVRTGTSSWALRQLAAGTGVSLSNADGVAGNPTISLANIPNAALTYSTFTLTQPAAGLSITSSVALGGTATFTLADDLAALEALSGSGLAVRTGTSSWAVRQLAAGTGVSLSNADGVAGNPTISLANIPNSALTNSAVTYSPGYGITGAGAVSLGGSASMAVALTAAETSLPSTQVDITSNTYAATGLSITLPAAGTYFVWAEMRQGVQVSANPNGFISTEFFNVTDSAAIANSERHGWAATVVNVPAAGPIHVMAIVTVAGAKTIELYAKRNSGPTYTNCFLYSDSDGRTRMGYLRIA